MQTIEEREVRLRPTPYRHLRLRALKLSIALSLVVLLSIAGIIWGVSAATETGSDYLRSDTETPPISVEALRSPLTATVSLPSTEYERSAVRSPEALRSVLSRFYDDETGVNDALVAQYAWMERSEAVEALQERLGIQTDGVYGRETREAHEAELAAFGLYHPPLPEVVNYTPPVVVASPAAVMSPRPQSRDDVPTTILDSIQSLWPEHEWDRALRVAWCESGYRLDAANPTSSARGVFQTLAPWTRAPGTGKSVWGWEHDPVTGEKLSAAAGLGISEDDARYGLGNIRVAYEIWSRAGGSWGAWTASVHCWG